MHDRDDEVVADVPDADAESCNKLLLNRNFANDSNFVLTSGAFSECSLSELSCSELTERPLENVEIFIRIQIPVDNWVFHVYLHKSTYNCSDLIIKIVKCILHIPK